jgi:hypothetical protein
MYTPMAIMPQARPWATAPGMEFKRPVRKLIEITPITFRMMK